MTESNLATTVMAALKPWDRLRVENPAHPGTPDINYCMGEGREGWIELKQEDEWPKRATTPLRVPHYTQQQRVWAIRRAAKGGSVWLLIQVESDYLLLQGDVAAKLLGTSTRSELIEAAVAHWTTKKHLTQDLKTWLSRRAT